MINENKLINDIETYIDQTAYDVRDILSLIADIYRYKAEVLQEKKLISLTRNENREVKILINEFEGIEKRIKNFIKILEKERFG